MNAAIIGATGLIGKHLLKHLLLDERYQNVFAIGRSEPSLNTDDFTAAQLAKFSFVYSELGQLEQLTLPKLIQHSFCTLGTTIKKAGSQQAFIEVDKTAVIEFAKAIIKNNQSHFDKQPHSKTKTPDKLQHIRVVTAIGADANSSVFYNRVKGELQQELAALDFDNICFYQPSLLLGHRDEVRILEQLGQQCFRILSPLFVGPLLNYKPIDARLVAESMLDEQWLNPPNQTKTNTTIISNQQMYQRQKSSN